MNELDALGVAGASLGVWCCMISCALIFGIGVYLVNAIGLQKMAKKLGFQDTWMAFVPVANLYLLGKTVEQEVDSDLVFNGTRWVIALYSFAGIIPFLGMLIITVGGIYMLICQCLLVNRLNNKWYNYVMLFILPGVSYMSIEKVLPEFRPVEEVPFTNNETYGQVDFGQSAAPVETVDEITFVNTEVDETTDTEQNNDYII